jgi:acylphosphatase
VVALVQWQQGQKGGHAGAPLRFDCNLKLFVMWRLELDRMEHLRARVIVHGLVQGVWFRQSTKDEATRIGVGGWAMNLPDGTVQALFEGEKKKVEEIVGWCHRGPSGARVSKVDIFWEPYKGEFKHFDIRFGR